MRIRKNEIGIMRKARDESKVTRDEKGIVRMDREVEKDIESSRV